jgi:hypothetical protein
VISKSLPGIINFLSVTNTFHLEFQGSCNVELLCVPHNRYQMLTKVLMCDAPRSMLTNPAHFDGPEITAVSTQMEGCHPSEG